MPPLIPPGTLGLCLSLILAIGLCTIVQNIGNGKFPCCAWPGPDTVPPFHAPNTLGRGLYPLRDSIRAAGTPEVASCKALHQCMTQPKLVSELKLCLPPA